MKYATIARYRGEFPVRLMCRVLDVSPSGFYAAQTRAPSARAHQDQALLLKIRATHTKSRRRYGAPRVHEALQAQGDYRIMLSPDHPTPLRTKTHSHGAVPFAIAGARIVRDQNFNSAQKVAAGTHA